MHDPFDSLIPNEMKKKMFKWLFNFKQLLKLAKTEIKASPSGGAG